MSDLVLDASVALRWVLPGDEPAMADRIRVLLGSGEQAAYVPPVFAWEIANSVVISERRNILGDTFANAWARAEQWLRLVQTDTDCQVYLSQTADLARHYRLTAYDAAYLELALRRRLPLATLDRQLQEAARTAGVRVDL